MSTPTTPKKKMGAGKIILIVIGAIILLGIIANLGKSGEKADAENTGTSTAPAATKGAAIGQTLKTHYFDVTVNGVKTVKKISDPNGILNTEAGAGNKFLIIDITFKNTDNESRMVFDGELHVNYQGKDYNYDKAEEPLLEGYGLFLEQLNPLVSKTTKLVYKIPEEVNGSAYYIPARADNDDKIDLGNIQ